MLANRDRQLMLRSRLPASLLEVALALQAEG